MAFAQTALRGIAQLCLIFFSTGAEEHEDSPRNPKLTRLAGYEVGNT